MALLLVLAILAFVLSVSGLVISFLNKKRSEKTKLGFLLVAIGGFLSAAALIVFKIIEG